MGRCGPRRTCVAQTDFTVPRPSPGPGQERPDAGRSPGLRVIARCTAFPGLAGVSVRPSGCDRSPWPAAICIALTAHSCRDSLGFGGKAPLTVFPFKLPFGSTNAIVAFQASESESLLGEGNSIGKKRCGSVVAGSKNSASKPVPATARAPCRLFGSQSYASECGPPAFPLLDTPIGFPTWKTPMAYQCRHCFVARPGQRPPR